MENNTYYKNELLKQPVAQTIIYELNKHKELTRAELLKVTGLSLATVYGKYVPRMIEYGVISETKGPTGVRKLILIKKSESKVEKE